MWEPTSGCWGSIAANTTWGRTGLEGFRDKDPNYLRLLFREPFTAFFEIKAPTRKQERFLTNIAAYAAKQGDPELRRIFSDLRRSSLPVGWTFLDNIKEVTLRELVADYEKTQRAFRVHLLTLTTPWSRAEDNRYSARLNALSTKLVQTELQIVWILGYPQTPAGRNKLNGAPKALSDNTGKKFDKGEKMLKQLARKWAEYRFLQTLYLYYSSVSLGKSDWDDSRQGDTIEEIKEQAKKKFEAYGKERKVFLAFRRENLASGEGLFLDRMERGLKVAQRLAPDFCPHVYVPDVRSANVPGGIYHMALGGDTAAFKGYFRNLQKAEVQAELLANAAERANFQLHSQRRPKHRIR